MSVKLPLRNPPQRRMIAGRPASCRDCLYVLDRNLREATHDGIEVVCCLEGPPRPFVWPKTDLEPFCGRFEPLDATVEANKPSSDRPDKRAAPARKPEATVPDGSIPTFGGSCPPEASSDARGPTAACSTVLDLGSVSLSLRQASSD